ncbi:MAG: hypothetical protein ACOCYR_08905, partial [Erythrobacter sp.]
MTATRDTTKAGFEGRRQDSAGAPRDRAQRDIVALGIATAAILLFIATGGAVMPKAIRAFAGV